ncbi:hypothetical protein FE391_10590 [Nonomuraea sp. KC401]|uniref:hypothetical protein n=1 Tax=unclassified Nonomuraea TaxID=2593643 RepID=UPI0010FF0054|nr:MULTISPECIES: hypothetical protein [unclassified Nonomuraea]NBE93233.1 hypothetical protein [Nonomuraea sp. K271]TLF78026.1 hypothetical protein FE391_10590 [Nonomuraea sp. KC401]
MPSIYSNHPAIRNLGRRRVFQINFWGEVGEGLEPLHLHHDGELIDDVMPPYEEGGYMALPDYRSFTTGLELDPDTELEQDVHTLLCLVGRITGRFADREWWTATRAFHRIPREAWEK